MFFGGHSVAVLDENGEVVIAHSPENNTRASCNGKNYQSHINIKNLCRIDRRGIDLKREIHFPNCIGSRILMPEADLFVDAIDIHVTNGHIIFPWQDRWPVGRGSYETFSRIWRIASLHPITSIVLFFALSLFWGLDQGDWDDCR